MLKFNGSVRITTIPLKALSDQVWIRYPCFCFFKLFIFIWGFSMNVTWAFLLIRTKQWRNYQNLTLFESTKLFCTFLIRFKFRGWSCTSGIAIFAWRFTWNYAYIVPPSKKQVLIIHHFLCRIKFYISRRKVGCLLWVLNDCPGEKIKISTFNQIIVCNFLN